MSERRKTAKGRVLKDGEYQRSNGTFEYRWTDIYGKRHSVYGKTLEALREKEKEVERLKTNGMTGNINVTFSEMYEKWISSKRKARASTIEAYKNTYSTKIKDVFGRRKVKDITTLDIKRFCCDLAERGLSKTTIHRSCVVINGVMEMCIDDSIIVKNPTHNALKYVLSQYDFTTKKVSALTYEQQKAFEKAIQANKHKDLYILMLYTGMRIGEALALKLGDIDFDKKEISITKTVTYKNKESRIGQPKTKTSIRKIPMLPQAEYALMNAIERRKMKDSTSAETDEDFGLIFSKDGSSVQWVDVINRSLSCLIRNYNNRKSENDVEIPSFSSHTFRHTFATRAFESGMDAKTIQHILGHATIGITMDIYTDLTPEHGAKQIKKICEYMADEL